MKPWKAKPRMEGGTTIPLPEVKELAQSPRGTSAPDPGPSIIHSHSTHNLARKVPTYGPGKALLPGTQVSTWQKAASEVFCWSPFFQLIFLITWAEKRALEGNCALMTWQPRHLRGTYCVHWERQKCPQRNLGGIHYRLSWPPEGDKPIQHTESVP